MREEGKESDVGKAKQEKGRNTKLQVAGIAAHTYIDDSQNWGVPEGELFIA